MATSGERRVHCLPRRLQQAHQADHREQGGACVGGTGPAPAPGGPVTVSGPELNVMLVA